MTAWLSAIQIPPISIQIMFINVFRHPVEVGLFSIFFPKGHNATNANLNICKPNGIPIIVIQSKNPLIRYSRKINIPPNSSQIILPSSFINEVQLNSKCNELVLLF